jgi:hypothetical protein
MELNMEYCDSNSIHNGNGYGVWRLIWRWSMKNDIDMEIDI